MVLPGMTGDVRPLTIYFVFIDLQEFGQRWFRSRRMTNENTGDRCSTFWAGLSKCRTSRSNMIRWCADVRSIELIVDWYIDPDTILGGHIGEIETGMVQFEMLQQRIQCHAVQTAPRAIEVIHGLRLLTRIIIINKVVNDTWCDVMPANWKGS